MKMKGKNNDRMIVDEFFLQKIDLAPSLPYKPVMHKLPHAGRWK